MSATGNHCTKTYMKIPGFTFMLFLLACNQPANKKEQQHNAVNAQISNDNTYKPDLQQIKSFLAHHSNYNQQIAIYIDMKIPSGKSRLFVVHPKTDSILSKGLVAQGVNTKNDEKGKLIFSNEPNSNCSSLGRYRIGGKYKGRFGDAYKLHGLDKSNSNAFARNVVLHSYYRVPDEEQEYPIMCSLGCPMVSINFLKKLEQYIDQSSKPILMEIAY